jgi:hypothetical protein
MSVETAAARGIPAWLLPVVAGVAAVAVGVTGFLIASPFAAPREADPEVVAAWELRTNDGFTPLAEVAAAGEPELAPTTVLRTDGVADAAAAIADALADADALAAGDEPSDREPAPFDGVTVLDPCPEAGDPAEDCPEGSRATVLATIAPPPLQVWAGWAAAEDCEIEPTTTSVGFRIVTTRPVSVAMRYFDDGRDQTATIATNAAQRAAWEASGADEDGEWLLITHCGILNDLTAGWTGILTVTVTADDGSTASDTVWLGTGAGLVVPPSWTRIINRTSLMVSVPGVLTTTAKFHALAVPFGQPTPSCDFSEFADVLDPVTTVAETITAAQLEERGYLARYTTRHTAFFVVPEASTVVVCAGSSEGSPRDWTVPEHLFSEVLYSPDLALPVITVEGFAVAPGVRANEVEITGSPGGAPRACGRWSAGDTEDGAVLCNYAGLDGSYPGWDAAYVLTARGSALGSASERVFVLPVSPQNCGLGCELPETTYIDVPISFRDPCLGDCPASFLGTVRLRVDWEHGTRSWQRDWLREEGPAPASDFPVLETESSPGPFTPVGADGDQFGTVRILTDVPTIATLSVYRISESAEPVLVDTRSTSALETERWMTFGPLEGGYVYYGLRVELTDAEGDTSVYASHHRDVRPWARGYFQTEAAEQTMAAQVTVSAADGAEVVVGSSELRVGSGGLFAVDTSEGPRLVARGFWEGFRSSFDEVICGAGALEVPFDNETSLVAAANPDTSLRLRLSIATRAEVEAEGGDIGCAWRGAGRTTETFDATIPYRDLLDGASVTVTNENGYTATIRLTVVD